MSVQIGTNQPFLVVSPLLTQGAVVRTGDDFIPGHYCSTRHVWIVNDHPIVVAQPDLSELTTKTEGDRERDDASNVAFLELQTKTKAEIERDDQGFELSLLELKTKTLSAIERDD